jgi:hemoglobin-like flavoprotein
MNTELIAETWGALGPRQARFIADFYDRFFACFPDYRRLVPHELGQTHLDKMAQVIARLAELADDPADIAPHLQHLAEAHRAYALQPADFGNFRSVFVESLGEALGPAWSGAAARAWEEAFDEILVPAMAPPATA